MRILAHYLAVVIYRLLGLLLTYRIPTDLFYRDSSKKVSPYYISKTFKAKVSKTVVMIQN